MFLAQWVDLSIWLLLGLGGWVVVVWRVGHVSFVVSGLKEAVRFFGGCWGCGRWGSGVLVWFLMWAGVLGWLLVLEDGRVARRHGVKVSPGGFYEC